MLSRFYERYPDYAEKTFLSVKVRIVSSASCHGLSHVSRLSQGGTKPKSMVFDSS